MRVSYTLLALIAWLTATASALHGEVLVLSFSDSHANSGNLEGFLLRVAEAERDFLSRHPEGEVILIAAGDIGGFSSWTQTGSEFWELLGLQHRYRHVIALAGNHETFDWNMRAPAPGEADGNERFLLQAQLYQGIAALHGKRRPKLLNASLTLTDLGRTIFAPFEDIQLKDGRRIRFFGMVLDEFFKKCQYSFQSPIQMFRPGVANASVVAEREMKRARQDGVDALVPVSHDVFKRVMHVREHLDRVHAETRGPAPHVPFAIAAHDHEVHANKEERVLDGGSQLEFIVAELGPDLNLVDVHHVDQAKLDSARTELSWDILKPLEIDFLKRHQPRIEARRDELSQVLAKTTHFLEKKHDTKEGPTTSGELMANATQIAAYRIARTMSQWMLNVVEPSAPVGESASLTASGLDSRLVIPRAHGIIVPGNALLDRRRKDGMIPVISFHNSSSMRSDTEFPEGTDMTSGDFLEFYAFPGEPEAVIVTVSEALALYRAMREDREEHDGTFTPQVSSNVILDDLRYPHRMYIYDGNELDLMSKDQLIVLAMDPFTARNGYRTVTGKTILKYERRMWLSRSHTSHQQNIHDIMPGLVGQKDCRGALIRANRDDQDRADRAARRIHRPQPIRRRQPTQSAARR